MPSDVNQRILEKIENGKFAPEVKAFLRLVLGYELEHFSEAKWQYGKTYDAEILRTVRKARTTDE